ncbi:acyltransferase [Streptomyces sp. NBC_01351]|uniref:acyltransferase family protein n=1 Tax=Streptomyces sp. NBC_01351 TaxID=2903833 RepID=UPI002E35A8E9|nr:acyltransferase [Streptomyces sp. NBC_01351]
MKPADDHIPFVQPAQDPAQDPRPRASSAPAPGARRSAPRLYVLDGLRLIAALGVLAFHWTASADAADAYGKAPSQFMPGISSVTSFGWLGVQLFFIISGFVICMSCWGRKPGDFFVSRVIRIYPGYWAAVLLTTAVLVLVPHLGRPGAREGVDIKMVLANLTMFETQLGFRRMDGVYWTLWAELQFYLLFAIVVTMGLTYRRVVAFCGIWATASILAPETNIPLLQTFAMPQEAPYFIAGVAMFLMYRFGPNLMLWGIVGFTWLVAISRIHTMKGIYDDAVQRPLSWAVIAVIITLCYVLIIAVALGFFDRIQWKWLTVAGALTYPLYLIHQEAGWTLIHWLRTLGTGTGAALAIALVVALVTAWLIHRLVERPVSGLMKRHLNKSLTAMRTASDRPDPK